MREDPTEELLDQLLKAHDQMTGQADVPLEPVPLGSKWRSRTSGNRTVTARRPATGRRGRLALATVLACVALGVTALLSVRAVVKTPSASAAGLSHLAEIAARQAGSATPGKGQYLYTASYELTNVPVIVKGKECNIEVRLHRQIWRATNGSGALNEKSKDARFASPEDARVCASIGITSPLFEDRSDAETYPAGKGGLPFIAKDWRFYSTNPRVLLRQVHKHDGGPNTSAELLVNVADYLREAGAPPAIRAALYRATALIPGIRVLGLRTDPRGQKGLAVAIQSSGSPEYLVIFDPHNSRLLAEEYLSHGRLTSWYAYTGQKIVNTRPNYPLSKS